MFCHLCLPKHKGNKKSIGSYHSCTVGHRSIKGLTPYRVHTKNSLKARIPLAEH